MFPTREHIQNDLASNGNLSFQASPFRAASGAMQMPGELLAVDCDRACKLILTAAAELVEADSRIRTHCPGERPADSATEQGTHREARLHNEEADLLPRADDRAASHGSQVWEKETAAGQGTVSVDK